MLIHGRLMLDPHRTPELGWIEVESDRIGRVEHGSPSQSVDLGGPDFLILPGFIDAHMHVPQIHSIGCDGMPLLEWLDQVIFPAEGAWADDATVRADIAATARRLIGVGTLGVAGFLSSHQSGPRAFRNDDVPWPIRATLGQALMDRAAPDDLIGHAMSDPGDSAVAHVQLGVNPRFAVSCTAELLDRAGEAAEAHASFVQTHLAETRAEVEAVGSLFPDAPNYTSVYDKAKLLGPRTLLAHCIHLSDDEWDLIARRGSVVVHCPTANTFLGSGMFNGSAARDHGVRLALGSDIAAGPDAAMPRVARAMIEVARTRSLRGESTGAALVPSPPEALDLITRGNAEALGWDRSGRIAPGCRADLLVLSPEMEFDRHWAGRLLYGWDERWLTHCLIEGRIHIPGSELGDA